MFGREWNRSDRTTGRSSWWKIFFIGLICLSIGYLSSGSFGQWFSSTTPHIARIEISGIIEDEREREQKLRALAENEHVKAVILHLNTPGGTVVGGESLYEAIKYIRSKKPLVAVMGDIATSAGYLVALGSDYIVARNGTLTGSIGVLLQASELTELSRKIGVRLESIKSSPLKGSPSPFERMSPEARRAMQDVVDDFYNLFVDILEKERKLEHAEALQLADGRVFTGSQALKLKLVDAIGGEEEAIFWLEENKNIKPDLAIRDVMKHPKSNKWEDFLRHFIGSKAIAHTQRISLQGLVSIW